MGNGIFLADSIGKKTLRELGVLLEQWLGRRVTLTPERYRDVVRHSHWLVVRDTRQDKKIIAMATLVPVYVPVGLYGRVQSMVVHRDFQGRGLEERMLEKLVAKARSEGMSYLVADEPANDFDREPYRKFGFFLANDRRVLQFEL